MNPTPALGRENAEKVTTIYTWQITNLTMINLEPLPFFNDTQPWKLSEFSWAGAEHQSANYDQAYIKISPIIANTKSSKEHGGNMYQTYYPAYYPALSTISSSTINQFGMDEKKIWIVTLRYGSWVRIIGYGSRVYPGPGRRGRWRNPAHSERHGGWGGWKLMI